MKRALLPCLLAVACGGVTEEDFVALQDQVAEQAGKIEELEQALEDAGAVDLTDLQDGYDSLQADHDTLAMDVQGLGMEVDALGMGQQRLEADLTALGTRVGTLEDSFGNDYWFVSAAPGTGLSSTTTWSDITGASTYVSLEKPGALALWGQVSGGSTCAHNIRLKMQSTSGSWEDFSEEVYFYASSYVTGAEATVFAIFDPGTGDYEVTLQSEKWSTSSGTCTIKAYSLAAIQLSELM